MRTTRDDRSEHDVADAVADAAERVRACTVDVRFDDGAAGAGIVWNDRGMVVTNAHVASRDRAAVQTVDGKRWTARVVARDTTRDLAAMQLSVEGVTSALLADTTPLRPGQLVLAVGSPLGVAGAVAIGVVHTVDRGRDGLPRYIRSSLRLAPGNSGGPLADVQGRIHGVNSMIVNGVGVALGIAGVHRFLRRAGSGRVLGVTLEPVSLRRRAQRSLGLLVTDVRPDSAAARAGIAVGDVLLAVDGEPIHEPAALSDRIDSLTNDEVLRLDVGHAGRARVVAVSFGRPAGRAA